MKPIVIVSDRICNFLSIFIYVGAITLFPFIIVRSEYNNQITINHEKIHIEQQKELLIVFFYVLYVYYWIKGKVKGLSNEAAYLQIPFEQEAYRKQYDSKYLEQRNTWDWIKFRNLY